METTTRAHPDTCACPPCFGGHATHWQREDALKAINADLLAALEQMIAAFPPPKISAANGFDGNLAHAVAQTAIRKARGDA